MLKTVLSTWQQMPLLFVSAAGAVSETMGMVPAVYKDRFRCTVYYTPLESGFVQAGGFNVQPTTKPGLQGHMYPFDLLRAVEVEGFGRINVPVNGLSYIRFSGGAWSFAAQPVGNRNNPLIPVQSCAVRRTTGKRIPDRSQLRILSNLVLDTFGQEYWNVADIGGMDANQIDLYWGEDDPFGPGQNVFRPAGVRGTNFTEANNVTVILLSY